MLYLNKEKIKIGIFRDTYNRGRTCRTNRSMECEKYDKKTVILESDKVVGGISRTVEKNGWKFDIGGHRFLQKLMK